MLDQYELMTLLAQYSEFIELTATSTEELRSIIKQLKQELDLRKVKYNEDE